MALRTYHVQINKFLDFHLPEGLPKVFLANVSDPTNLITNPKGIIDPNNRALSFVEEDGCKAIESPYLLPNPLWAHSYEDIPEIEELEREIRCLIYSNASIPNNYYSIEITDL
jgi:hypothetical protein